VAVDGAGRLMAVEGLYDGVEFFDAQGRFLFHLGGSGSEPGQFWLPGGLAFDPVENLFFVADSYNGRVQVFRLLSGGAS
jgi:sugar lactone lactonase YvrE